MSKKKKTIIIVALLLVVFIGSISYALWSVTLEQTGSNVVKTGCFTVNMQEESPAIELAEAYPIKDSEGWDYDPFTFTIQNTCNIDSSYSVNLEVEEGTTLSHSAVKVGFANETPQILTAYEKDEVEDKYQLTTGTLAGASSEGAGDGESITYDLRLWLDENTSKDEMSKDFYAKIVVENITTSGVVAREVLATADISEAQDGSITYTLYSTGELVISGTGRMQDSSAGGIAAQLGINYISSEEFVSRTTPEEQAVMSTEEAQFLRAPLTDNYEVFGNLAKDALTEDESLCATLPETYDEYKTCLKELGITNESFYSLMDKVNEYIPKVKSLSIEEGITYIGNDQFSYIKESELIIPSTVTEIGSYTFRGFNGSIDLNDGLITLGENVFEYATIDTIIIPDTVTSIGVGLVDYANIGIVQLPKNNTYTGFIGADYVFEGARNVTIIIPENITEFSKSAFAQAENLTLNFECSESELSSSALSLIEYLNNYGGGVTVNYDYQI